MCQKFVYDGTNEYYIKSESVSNVNDYDAFYNLTPLKKSSNKEHVYEQLYPRRQSNDDVIIHVNPNEDPLNTDKISGLNKLFIPHCPTCNQTINRILYKGDIRCVVCRTLYYYKCKQCNRFYKSAKAANNHLFYETNRLRTHCPHCDFRTFTRRNLEIHLSLVHPNETNSSDNVQQEK